MFNIGGGEVLVIALIALIAVGPEQLPGVMRKVGAFVGQIRGMTAGLRDEFMSGVDEMKAGVEDLNPEKWMGDGSADKPIVPRGYAENSIKTAAGPNASNEEPPARSGPDPAATENIPAPEDHTAVEKITLEDDNAAEETVAASDETDTEDSA